MGRERGIERTSPSLNLVKASSRSSRIALGKELSSFWHTSNMTTSNPMTYGLIFKTYVQGLKFKIFPSRKTNLVFLRVAPVPVASSALRLTFSHTHIAPRYQEVDRSPIVSGKRMMKVLLPQLVCDFQAAVTHLPHLWWYLCFLSDIIDLCIYLVFGGKCTNI